MKAKELIKILRKNSELELGEVEIRLNLSDKSKLEKRKIMLDFVKVFGKFKKRLLGENEIYLKHESHDINIILWEYDRCNIVGHIVKKRLVLQPSIPVEMVQAVEEYMVPVSDCQIQNGEVKSEEVVFTEVKK